MVDFIKLMVGVVIFVMFVSGGVFLLNDNMRFGNINPNQGVDTNVKDVNTSLQIVKDKMDNIYVDARSQYNATIENEDDKGSLDGFGYLVVGGYKALTNVVKSFSVINTVFVEIASVLNIHKLFVDAFVVIILLTITITIIYMLFRFQPRST